MDPKRRQTLLVVGALLSFAIFGGDRWVVAPLSEAWDARAERIAELQRQVSKGQALLERRSQFEQTWEEMKDSGLPADQAGAEALILKSVDGWARDSGLAVGSIKPRLVQSDEERPMLEFRASARGSIESIARFLWLVETSPLPLRVGEVEIASREKALDDLTVNVTFSGLMLASPQPRETPQAEQPEREDI